MPLGTRDVLLIIRAKDQASRIIAGVGKSFAGVDADARAAGAATMAQGVALAGMGIGIAAIGAAGVVALNNWREAAVNYNKDAAKTLTQVDQTGVSVQQIGQIGLDVAKKIPAPLDQLQGSLYDIFSSMDVSVGDSQKILESFAKSAVAGNVDVSTAGRQTIAEMNAFGLTTADLGRLQDVNFQLVRKGVGTYADFAGSIGKAIPSAARAGQSVESLAGVMAFMTRNGLSTSMAATSAARSFDNLANPKVINNFKKMGISVTDASGAFRPMVDIAGELSNKLGPLTDVDRAAALDKLFKGGGNNIQARRFWDLAIRDFGTLNTLTGDMQNSSGALDSAYNIMFNQPANQAQLLQNNLDALKIELGEKLIPAFNFLVEKALLAVQWFDGLSDSTKTLIVQIIAGTSAFLIIAGACMILVGAIKAIQGATQMIGGLSKILDMSPTLLIITALALAAYAIYKNWDKIKPYWEALWAFIQEKAQAFMDWFMPIWNKYWPVIKAVALEVWAILQEVWDQVLTAFQVSIAWFQDTFIPNFIKVWKAVVGALQVAIKWILTVFVPGFIKVWNSVYNVVSAFINWFNKNVVSTINAAIELIMAIFGRLEQYVRTFIMPALRVAWAILAPIIETVFNLIKTTISVALDFIWGVIRVFIDVAVKAWSLFGDNLLEYISIAFNFIKSIIETILGVIRGIIQIVTGLITGDWSKVWEGIQTIAETIWGAIQVAIETAINTVKLVIETVTDAVKLVLFTAWDLIKTTAGTVWDAIKLAITAPIDLITAVLQGVWDGITTAASIAWDWIKTLAQLAWDGIKSVITTPIDAITAVLQGIWDGLKTAAETAWNGIKAAIDAVVGPIVRLIQNIIDKAKEGIDIFKQLLGLSGDGGPPSEIPGVPGSGNLVPKSKMIVGAAGFLVNGATMALIGEAGPEALIPLNNAARALQLLRMSGLDRLVMSNMQGSIMRPTNPGTVGGGGAMQSSQQIGMYIAHAEFHDHTDVVAAQKVTNQRLATMGVT